MERTFSSLRAAAPYAISSGWIIRPIGMPQSSPPTILAGSSPCSPSARMGVVSVGQGHTTLHVTQFFTVLWTCPYEADHTGLDAGMHLFERAAGPGCV